MKILLKALLVSFLALQSFAARADFSSALDAYGNKDFKVAFEKFTALAEIGEKRAQFNLGIMYFQGQSVNKDINKAFAWTKLATENESSTEQERNIHQVIAKKVENMTLAEAEYESLATNYADDVLLERLYPVLLEKDKLSSFDVKPIMTKMPKYPRRAAMNGVQGYVSFKFDLDKLGNKRNLRISEAFPLNVFETNSLRAISRWRFEPTLDENGKPIEAFDVSYKMVFSLSSGGLTMDKDLYLKTKAEADNGVLKSQVLIGFWHKRFNNLPSKENPTEWLFKAAKQGSLLAQYEVGESLLNGKGCISDRAKGVEWLTRAAASGQVDAMNLLAGLATSDSSLEAQKQALYYISKLKKLTPSTVIRLSWLLSTSSFEEVSNPEKALSLLEKIEWKEFKDNVTKQEIQAAAYAALGKFSEAIEYQEDALDDAEDLDFDVTELKAHLALYKQNKKWF
jgi:TonB family protein